MRVLTAVILALLAGSGLALDRTGTIMEARVFFSDKNTLDQLGELAGELDICTWEEDGQAGYLVINTDAGQLARIQATGLKTEITWADIRQKFYQETGVDPDDPDGGRDFGFFFTYWEMQDSLDSFAANFPDICHKYSLGPSHQGRPVWCLKISDNPQVQEDEPACYFNGAIHAREPMGTSCVMNFAAQILSEYGTDPVVTWIIDNREIYLVPVQNPDGYVYNSDSGGASSNWRKNRRIIQSPYVGVDLNRNYAYKWGYDNQGSSSNPSSETYRGPSRFSEPATAVIQDFMNSCQVRTCMDYHTYGRYNMYPWCYDYVDPPQEQLLQEMVDTFRVNNGYPANHTGQVSQVLYKCNGVSVDWEYSDTTGKFVTYAFTCELATGFWTGWNDSAYIRQESNLNIPNLYYLARLAGVWFDPVSVTVNDTATGNQTGELDPGETAHLWFTIRNRAVHELDSAYQITGLLVSEHPDMTVLDSIKPFPDVQRLSSTHNHAAGFVVLADSGAVPGTHVPMRLEVNYIEDGQTYMIPLNFEVVLGSNPVGIAEAPTTPGARVLVFPNPAGPRVSFMLPGQCPARLTVYASNGSRLLSTRTAGPRYDWNCSDIPAGVYFLRCEAGKAVTTTRFNIAR